MTATSDASFPNGSNDRNGTSDIRNPYHARGTVVTVRERFSFTPAGLDNLAVYEISPTEAWRALTAPRRLARYLDTDLKALFAEIAPRRRIVLFLVESATDDSDWNIVAGRPLAPDENDVFDKLFGGHT